MNDEKKIAQAILNAQKMQEESYEETSDIGIGGYYQLDMETCLIATCKQQDLSDNLWCLLNLAMHWYNNIQLWANDVLANKNILEECEKEDAKMRDDMKDKVIDNCPCDSFSKEACDQCQETNLANPNKLGK